MNRAVVATLLLAGCACIGRDAQGQSAATELAVTAGRATDAFGVSASAVTVTPTISVQPDRRASLTLGAHGTRFANAQWAAGALGGVNVRVPLAERLAFTASSRAAYTVTGYDATYTSLVAIPALEATVGRATAYGGAQLARGSSRVERTSIPTGSPFPIGGGSTVETIADARSLRGLIYGAGAGFDVSGGAGFVGYREERSGVADVGWVDRSLHLSIAGDRVTIAAGAGFRGGGGDGAFGGGSLSYAVTPSMSAQLAGARYLDDHVTGTVGGNALSLGIVLRAGTARATMRGEAPVVRGAPAPATGMQRVAIRAPRAARVEVLADWTDWTPVAATRAPDGHWYVDVRLAPGRYRYAFRIDGSRWEVPEGAAAVDDEFGGRSAWLTVK